MRDIGFSFHDTADVLDEILTAHPEVDFVQLQINYLDWESPAIQSRLNYETATRHGKPVTVMEPVKGGTLARLPQEAADLLHGIHPDWSLPRWAISFVASLPNVRRVLSGMNTMAQVEDNTGYMRKFTPLGETEREALTRIAAIVNAATAIPCTGYSYCTSTCPKHIPIPRYFSLYNADMQELETKDWTTQLMLYGHLAEATAPASACLRCGRCEKMCPQHLPIRSWLEKVAAHFEHA